MSGFSNQEKAYLNLLVDRLGEDLSVHLARRTIAKYREAIDILPPGHRKDQ